MKTIEVTYEQYEFLKQAQNLLKTQKNRYTRDPFYCIMKKERQYGFSEEYSSDFVWCGDDVFFETVDDLFDDVMENYEKEIRQYVMDYYDVEGPIKEEDLFKEFEDLFEDSYSISLEEFLDERNYYRVYYRDNYRLDENSNIWSFFEIDAQEYADSKYGKDSKIAYS